MRLKEKVFLWDTDPPFEEIIEVYPGQLVYLMIGFNRLGSLEIPFEDLVGRTLTPLYFLRGQLNHKENQAIVIGPGDEWKEIAGFGVLYTVPVDAQPGLFQYYGGIYMTGARCVENWDWRFYPVVE